VVGPVLEIGGRSWQGRGGNAASVCRDEGIAWEGSDIVDGPGVGFLMDILDSSAVEAVGRLWASVLVFNLLEHVYDPITALTNAMKLVAPGGVAAVAGPAVWQLHDYPADYWRPMPDFFLEFASRNGCQVLNEDFMWLVEGKMLRVDLLSVGSQKQLPSYSRPGAFHVWSRPMTYWSRALHQGLRTFGRDTPYPTSGLGVCLKKPLG